MKWYWVAEASGKYCDLKKETTIGNLGSQTTSTKNKKKNYNISSDPHRDVILLQIFPKFWHSLC